MAHETRVAGLEARLAELSETVGGYDRLRQQDQHAIQKLKDQLIGLEDSGRKDFGNSDSVHDATRLATKIRELYAQLLDMDNKKSSSSENVQGEKSAEILEKFGVFLIEFTLKLFQVIPILI